MLLWIRQALFPISAIVCHDPIRFSPPGERTSSPSFSGLSFFLLHPILISLICEFKGAVVSWCMCFERHIDRNLPSWKFEIMQISGCDIHRALQSHLNTERYPDVLTSYDTCIIRGFYGLFCLIHISHNSQYYRCYLGIRQQLSPSFSLFS